jgi:hypothetical protein
MSWRERIAAEAAKAKDKLGEELTGLVAGPDGNASPEGFVLGLVRSARDPEDEPLSEKQVRKDAKKRRRRLGIASFAAGPLAGAAGEATDLYTETATVCDLVDLHDLTLSDVEIGAHMLVLWRLTDDLASARSTLDGTGPTLWMRLSERYRGEVIGEDVQATVPNVVKAIWKQRELHADLREAAGQGSFKRVLRAGSQTKEFLARAEAQLGVTPS